VSNDSGVVCTRKGIVESIHRVHAVVVDAAGELAVTRVLEEMQLLSSTELDGLAAFRHKTPENRLGQQVGESRPNFSLRRGSVP
jgi:hypothetical protein